MRITTTLGLQGVVVYGTSKRVSFRPRPDYRLIVAEMTLAR